MNRRQALEMLGAASLSALAVPAAARPQDRDPILEFDCLELLARIRNGVLSAEQVCQGFLQNYERHRSLNVATWMDGDRVLSRARDIDRARAAGTELPVLAGLPLLIKDNIDTLGFPTSAGTPALKRYFPRQNAPVVERLVQQGALVMGKANMDELAAGGASRNEVFGFVRNPYNPELIAGGSSGGSAAAIAARIVPAALGTDTGGSVRIPAAFCGIVGFRPSVYPRKMYSERGVVPGALDLCTIGPMGRSVADVALLHSVIVGQRLVSPRSLKGMRIGLPRLGYWDDLDPEVEQVTQAALARLRDKGVLFREIDLREITTRATKLFGTLLSGGIADLEAFLRAQVPSVSLRSMTEQIASRSVRTSLEHRIKIGAASDLLDARGTARKAISAAYGTIFRRHRIQAVMFPAQVLPPPAQAAGDGSAKLIEFNGRLVPEDWALAHNTLLAPALGVPALSVPAGLTRNGLPVALEFDGLPGNDSALLAIGRAAEAAIGRIPPPKGMELMIPHA